MYNIVITLYLIGVAIASLFSEKVRKMWRGERRTIQHLKEHVDPDAKYIWVHAASLGEFEQGRPIIERIKATHPEDKILLTFFSPSGYEVRKNYEGADIICYLPLDTIRNSRRFLRAVRPVCALFIKYEFWYNYLHILKHRQVPVYSVSSIFRPEQIFFRWYGHQYSRVLKCFTHFFVQNEVSKQLLEEKLKITAVTVTGDTRFDRVISISEQATALPLIEKFCSGSRVFVAGSSWQPDEEVFIPYFSAEYREQRKEENGKEKTEKGKRSFVSMSSECQTKYGRGSYRLVREQRMLAKQKAEGRKREDRWKLVIAPHVIGEDHLQQIERMLRQAHLTPLRYSTLTSSHEEHGEAIDADALIIDCFGLLSSVYRYADVAYVGGGFGVGIHNLLEAAVWGTPVFFGPNNARFQEAQELKACGGGIEITSAESFRTEMDSLLADTAALQARGSAAGEYVRSHAGATEAIIKAIKL